MRRTRRNYARPHIDAAVLRTRRGPRSGGFTLIELVVVIVILSIIAAIALPRFLNMRSAAYKATVATVAGQLQSAAQIARQLCIVRRWAGQDNLPGFGNGTVDFNANCYPSDTNNVNTLTANAAQCARIFSGILTTSYVASNVAAPTPDFLITLSGGNCRFTFQRDSVTRRFDYAPATGTVLNLVNP